MDFKVMFVLLKIRYLVGEYPEDDWTIYENVAVFDTEKLAEEYRQKILSDKTDFRLYQCDFQIKQIVRNPK